MPPLIVSVARGFFGCSARTNASTRRASSADGTRTSTIARARSAITLDRVPPSNTPTLTDVPRARSLSGASAFTICASSWTALTPLPGSMPACAATPPTSSVNSPTPLRLVLTAPPGSDGSSTNTALLLRASASSSGRAGPAPDFFVGRPQHHDADRQARRDREQRARGQHGDRDARFHVERAGAVEAAVLLDDRHPFERADRPDRIEVPEQQDLIAIAGRQTLPRRSAAPGAPLDRNSART